MAAFTNGKAGGWYPDIPDQRDRWYHTFRLVPGSLTPRVDKVVDLRRFCPPIWDQGNLGSCTAHGIAAMLEFNRNQQKLDIFTPSRLFIYYNERRMENSVSEDAGATIRDGIKTVAADGYAPESVWPYHPELFAFCPPPSVYQEAIKYKAMSYYRLDNSNLNTLRTCIDMQDGFVFGITVYDSFYQGDSNGGYVPMPKTTEKLEGGHCMAAVGYDDFKKVFVVRNSWGTDVGDKGYYYMPYDYLTNLDLSEDFWCIKTVT